MKKILFDFNGTMVFDGPYHDQAWRKFVKEYLRRELEEEELLTHFHGAVNDKIIQRLFPLMNQDERNTLSLHKEALYRSLCKEDHGVYTLVEGLSGFLEKAKQKKIKMNIASASIEDNIRFFVEVFQLQHYFDVEKICFDDGSYQNKVKMFQDAAFKIDATMQDCIVFEDSLSGIACAKEAGAYAIVAIAPKEQQKRFEKIEGIALIIKDFNDKRIWELWKKEK